MIKQFRYYQTCSFKYTVVTYHDGIEQSCESMWKTELDDYIDRLYDDGYVYCYTKTEVESAHKRYLKIKELQLVDPEVNKNPCDGCMSDGRICCNYVLSGRQIARLKDRIKVIIINEELGY